MNSATKVGEIFTKAGESFHKMADMTMLLDVKAQELSATTVKKQVRFFPVFSFFLSLEPICFEGLGSF